MARPHGHPQFVESLETRVHLAFGQVDTAWGTAGRVITDVGITGAMVTKLIPAGNQMYAVGRGATYLGNAAIVRYNADGTIDTSFGDQGKATLPALLPTDAIVTPDGSIVASLTGDGHTRIIKLTSAGQIDTTFGDAGITTLSDDLFNARTLAFAGGKIILAGTDSVDDHSYFTRVYRLRGNGQLDSTFGKRGKIDYFAGLKSASKPHRFDNVSAVRAMDDGTIIVTGGSLAYHYGESESETVYGNVFLVAARFSTHGVFDASYGDQGFSRITVPAGELLHQDLRENYKYPDGDFSLATRYVGSIQSDGSLIMAGRGLRVGVASLNPDGTAKYTSFADGDFPLDLPTNIQLIADGRAILSGVPSRFYWDHGPALAQVSADGVIGPYVLTDDQNPSTPELVGNDVNVSNGGAPDYDLPHPMLISPDGKLILGGIASGQTGFAMEKFSVGSPSDPRTDLFVGATSSSLGRDAAGGLHMAFYDSITHTLKYAYRAINGRWRNTLTIDATQFAGTDLSLALDNDNNPSIAYHDGLHGDLRFARSTDGGKTWSTELVDSSGSTGLYPSLLIDNDIGTGKISVAYYRKTSGDLRYAVRNSNGSWTIQNIDTADDVGRHCRLTRDPYNQQPLGIAYTDETTNSVKLATLDDSGVWQTEVAAQAQGAVDHLSILFGPFDPAISFYDAAFGDLKIATREGHSNGPPPPWSVISASTQGAIGLYSALTFFGTFNTHLQAYEYDRTHDRVLLRLGPENDPDAAVAIEHGGKYLSLARDRVQIIRTGDAAFFDTGLGGLRVGTVFNPFNDSFDDP